jgi:hypothetical protein
MGDPVIFDDGGSTRIRRVLLGGGIGAMNSLLDVGPLKAMAGVPVPAGTPGSQHKINSAFANIVVVFQDSTGAAFTIGPTAFANCEVTSGDQKVRGDIVAAGTALVITAFSLAGQEPLVEAKQHHGKRHYVVTNAPSADQVAIDGRVVLDTSAPPMGAVAPILFTSVVLT